MERQLSLIERRPAWQLDERTRAAGRQGIAKAREALRTAQQRRLQGTEGPGAAGHDRGTAPPSAA